MSRMASTMLMVSCLNGIEETWCKQFDFDISNRSNLPAIGGFDEEFCRLLVSTEL